MLLLNFLLLGVVLLTIQTTLFQLMPNWLGRPDLVFLLVIFLAYRIDIIRGAALTFMLGLLMDIFSGIFLGLYPVVYLLIFFFLKAISRQLAIGESAYQGPMVAASYLFAATGLFLFVTILSPDNPPSWSWGIILLQVLLISVISIPLFGLFDYVRMKTPKKISGWQPFTKKSGNRFRT